MSARNVGWRSGHARFITLDLLFQNASMVLPRLRVAAWAAGVLTALVLRGYFRLFP
jgi:hypothetical protein